MDTFNRSLIMTTTVKNWFFVTVMDGDVRVGSVIYADVIEDESFRFSIGDYVCTSNLVEINPEHNLAITASGSDYKLIGKGRKAIIDFDDFELLRNGFSPLQIKVLNNPKQILAH